MDEPFDAVIVGAGLAGALIAKQLGTAGKRVLILESGAAIPVNLNDYMQRFYMAAFKTPEIPYTPELFAQDGTLHDPSKLNAPRASVLTLDKKSWQDPAQSYLIQKGPLAFGSTFERIGGGTARHWLGSSFRHLPNDFESKTRYGQLENWPIGYNDLNHWYCEAENEIGVSADTSDQTYHGVTFPAGYQYPLPPIPPSTVDQAIQAAITGMNVDGAALSVRGTPAGRNSAPFGRRPQCAGNTNCIPICPIQAKYDPSVTINEALENEGVTISYQTVVSEILIDGTGHVSGVKYLKYDKPDGPQTGSGVVQAKVYILAAHAIETPKLLLRSKNQGRTPNGVGNTSGMVGKNLMDHPLYLAWGLAKTPVFPYRGPLSTSGIEELRDGDFRKRRAAFRIEIGNEGWNFPIGDPTVTAIDFVNGTNQSGSNTAQKAHFGSDLVTGLNDILTRQFRLAFLVEQSPEERNSVGLAAETDNLGLQRPSIRYDFSDYTKAGLAAAKALADQIFDRMRARQLTTTPAADDPSSVVVPVSGRPTRIRYFGSGHIAGTCRMGTVKASSVLDPTLRSWDHPNLFVCGSSVFPTIATGNPSLTIAALALRAADNILRTDLR
jgi:choline dehydrogenase-like flavoprotein